MTHRISGDRADAQICEETPTVARATDGTALKGLEQEGKKQQQKKTPTGQCMDVSARR